MEIFDFIVPKDKTNPPADWNSFEKFLFQKKKIRWNCISRVRETWRIISTTFFPFHSLIHGSIVLSEKLRSYKFRSQNQLTASTTNRYFTGKIRNFCVYMNVIILTKKKLKRHLCFEGEMFEIPSQIHGWCNILLPLLVDLWIQESFNRRRQSRRSIVPSQIHGWCNILLPLQLVRSSSEQHKIMPELEKK